MEQQEGFPKRVEERFSGMRVAPGWPSSWLTGAPPRCSRQADALDRSGEARPTRKTRKGRGQGLGPRRGGMQAGLGAALPAPRPDQGKG